MATYSMTLHSDWTPETLFAYMARFSNAAEWDPGVASGEDLTGDEPALNSEYRLVIAGGRNGIPLTYKIIEFDLNHRVVLHAENSMVRSRDEIEVSPAPNGGSIMTFSAKLTGRGLFSILEPLIARAFKQIGKRAQESLTARVAS